jgi:hypothetical protein
LYSNVIYILGMPIQSTTDCGTETVDIYGFANALRYNGIIYCRMMTRS